MTIYVKPSYKYAKKGRNESSEKVNLNEYNYSSDDSQDDQSIRPMNDKHRKFPLPKLKSRQLPHQHQPETLISQHLNKTTTFQDIPERYDLYNRAPNVTYIKEKYNVYSDWVKLNKRELNEANAANPQLNWYHFQKSVYNNEKDCFKFLKNLNPDETNNQKLQPIQYPKITSKEKYSKKYYSTMDFCNDPTNKVMDTENRSFSTELSNESKRAHPVKLTKITNTLQTIKTNFFANLDKNHNIDRSQLSARLGIELKTPDQITNGILHNRTRLTPTNSQNKSSHVHFIDDEIKETDSSEKNSATTPRSFPLVVERQPSKANKATTLQTNLKILPPINVRFSEDFYACLNAEGSA